MTPCARRMEGIELINVLVVGRDGTETLIHAEEGTSLMEVARDVGIDGIEAVCGGYQSCATCHVYVAKASQDIAGVAGEDEAELLNTLTHRRANSRLSCQIELGQALDGIRVTVAPQE